MEEIIQLILKSYGLVGVVLLAPYAGLVYLWRELKQSNGSTRESQEQRANDAKSFADSISGYNEKIVEAHKLRVQDAQRISEKLITLTSEHSSVSKETNLALDRLGDLMVSIRAERR